MSGNKCLMLFIMGLALISSVLVENIQGQEKMKILGVFKNEVELKRFMGQSVEPRFEILPEKYTYGKENRELKFYDSNSSLLATSSFNKWSRFFQSQNGNFLGVTELDETQRGKLKFTLFDRTGKIIYHKDDFYPIKEWGPPSPRIYIKNDGRKVIAATMNRKEASYAILFYDITGNIIKRYPDTPMDREKYEFDMGRLQISPNEEYLVIAGKNGVFAFDWSGNILWEYNIAKQGYSRSMDWLIISPQGNYIFVMGREWLIESNSGTKEYTYILDRKGKVLMKTDGWPFLGHIAFFQKEEEFVIEKKESISMFTIPEFKRVWEYKLPKIDSKRSCLSISSNDKYLLLVNNLSDSEKRLDLFDSGGHLIWSHTVTRSDLGDQWVEPKVEFSKDNKKIMVRFGSKILLMEHYPEIK